MKKIIALLFVTIPLSLIAQEKTLTINDFLSIVCRNSDDYKIHEIQIELNRRQYSSDIHPYNYKLSFSLQSQYNHSINAITQPDGSIDNHNLSNYSTSPTINFSIPLYMTGGTISFSSNLNYYKSQTTTNYKSNFSANIYQFSFSQPIHLHNSIKWGIKAAKASLWLSNCDIINDYISLKAKACSLYFDLLESRLVLKRYESLLHNLDTLEYVYSNLYSQGKILKVELDEIQINKKEIIDKIEYYNTNLTYNTKTVNNMIGYSLNIDSITLKLPNEVHFIDYQLVNMMQKKKQAIYDKFAKISLERNVIETKNNKGIQISLGAGLGTNSSAEHFHDLWKKKTPTYNLSISARIPISDMKDKNNQYNMAKLRLKQYEISSKSKIKADNSSIEKLVSQFNNSIVSLKLSNEKEEYLKEEITIKKELLLSKKILFDDYNRTAQKIIENELNKVSYARSIYNYLYKIESLTLHDLINDIDYYEENYIK